MSKSDCVRVALLEHILILEAEIKKLLAENNQLKKERETDDESK